MINVDKKKLNNQFKGKKILKIITNFLLSNYLISLK